MDFCEAATLPWLLEPDVFLCVKGAADWPDWFKPAGDESLAAALDYAMENGESAEFELGDALGRTLLELKKQGFQPSQQDKLAMLYTAVHVLETFIECTDDGESPIWPGLGPAEQVTPKRSR